MDKLLWGQAPSALLAFPFFIIGTLLLLTSNTAASPQALSLNTAQITDHSATGEDIFAQSMLMQAAANSAHVIWLEQNLANTNTDLFYRSLPTGLTQRLSNTADSNGSVIIFPTLKVSSADEPHVIWEEDAGTSEMRDLYYWTPATGTQRLTDRAATEGSVVFDSKQLWLDQNEAHVVWQEPNNSQSENIFFYWNSVTDTTLQLPNFAAGDVKDGVLHIVWEAGFNGPVQYWNSRDQVTVSLPNSTTPSNASAKQAGIYADEDGSATVFYGLNSLGDSVTNCLSSWNSGTQTAVSHVTGEQCWSLNNVVQDGSGTFHAFGVDSDSVSSAFMPFYWNSSLASPIIFDTSSAGTGFGIPSADLHVADNGNAHILWQDSHDFFYWNPADQQVVNLSAALGPNTNISGSDAVFLDAAGELNHFWREQASQGSASVPLFWESGNQVTQNLLTKFGMTSIVSFTLPGEETGYTYLFQGIPNAGAAGVYAWTIATDTLTPLWEGTSLNGFAYAEDTAGNIFVLWQEAVTYLLHLYSSADGLTTLNSTATTEADDSFFKMETDSFGNLFISWTEDSDTAGKGVDYFAAWPTEFIEGSAKLYLPLVTR